MAVHRRTRVATTKARFDFAESVLDLARLRRMWAIISSDFGVGGLRVPYTIDCTPAPVTITVRHKLNWQALLGVAWVAVVFYPIFGVDWRHVRVQDHRLDIIVVAVATFAFFLSLIRRERIEIYPDRMVWRRTYFGITNSTEAPLEDVIGAEWSEGNERGEGDKEPDHVVFYLPGGSVKSCRGFTFEDFDRMREDIRLMYPDLIKRWGRARVRSKDFTLLNLT